MLYRASTKDCRECALKARCTKGAKRIVTRNLYEAEREHVRGLKEMPAFKHSARLRKKVEMRFAHLKRNLNFRRLRLRVFLAQRTSSCWPPPLRICESWRNFDRRLWPSPKKAERASARPTQSRVDERSAQKISPIQRPERRQQPKRFRSAIKSTKSARTCRPVNWRY